MKEPTSAALLYNQDESVKGSKRILLYDLGGGTFDVSVVTISEQQDSDLDAVYGLASGDDKTLFSVVKILGDMRLGGDDVDGILAQRCIARLRALGVNQGDLSAFDRERIVLWVEQNKKRGVATYAKETTINGKKVEIRLEPSDFAEAFSKIYAKTKVLVDRVLASPEVSGKVDQIITVGGSTKSYIIRQLLRRDFPNIALNTSMNPDESVALGAAIGAKRAKFGDDSVNILDCLAMNIGILSEGYVQTVLRAGEQIPCSHQSTFYTVVAGQKSASLAVYQGMTKFPDECTLLGKLMVDDLNLPEDKLGQIVVTLVVNSNGILEILAETPNTEPQKMALVNVAGVSTHASDNKQLQRWKRFANGLSPDDCATLLSLIAQYESGGLDSIVVSTYIKEHKKAVGEYVTNVKVGHDNG
ncbi:hypothetical protein AGMMS49975_23920 [Clostridia bacterium]|nr:hypothetical protein AGMMS49975_23920 [Clostridia bacterium]